MSRRTIFGQPVVPRLTSLLDDVEHGVIEVPRFQRPFVWKDEQRLKLMDSIVRGMPIGSLLVWRSEKIDLATYPTIGPFAIASKDSKPGPRTYLLDGHQRISTLYGALRPIGNTNTTNDREDDREEQRSWPIYFDLSADPSENAFRLSPRRFTPPVDWLPLSLLFSPVALFGYQKTLIENGYPEYAKEAERLANVFKDYLVPVIPIESDDLDTVTESFSRVNSQGTAMSEVHMVEALTFSAAFDLERKLNDVQQQLAQYGWGDVDHQTLINTLKVGWGLNIHKAGPADVARKLKDTPDAVDQLLGRLQGAIVLLQAAGIYGWAALPSANQLIALADAMHRCRSLVQLKERRQALVNWVHATTYGSYFTGMRSNDIATAIAYLHGTLVPPFQWRPPNLAKEAEPIDSFNAGSVRGLGMARMMARHAEPEGSTSHQWLLGNLGTKGILKILPQRPAKELGNRVVIDVPQLRTLQQGLEEGTLSEDEQRRYIISPEAAAAYARGDHDAFIQRRREHLRALEADELRRLGFTLPDYPPSAESSA